MLQAYGCPGGRRNRPVSIQESNGFNGAIQNQSATVLVFAAFGVHVWSGGAYELRTVGAMSLRSIVWISIAITASRLAKSWTAPIE